MARDKDFELRMSGMNYALEIAKKDGVEGLEKEVMKRGLFKVPFSYTQTQRDNFLREVSHNLYMNMMATFAYALNLEFGFGKERLIRLRKTVSDLVEDVFDLDYMGERYVRLEDYATEMNERYDLGLDVDIISDCQKLQDTKENGYHFAEVERIIQVLESDGYKDAAEFLKTKIN